MRRSQSVATGSTDTVVEPHVCRVNGAEGGDRPKGTAFDHVLAGGRGSDTRARGVAQGSDGTGKEGPQSGSPLGRLEQEYITPAH